MIEHDFEQIFWAQQWLWRFIGRQTGKHEDKNTCSIPEGKLAHTRKTNGVNTISIYGSIVRVRQVAVHHQSLETARPTFT